MPKASIKRPDGTSIVIEGGAAEVAALVRELGGAKSARESKGGGGDQGRSRARPKANASLSDLLISLIDGGFFKKPKDLTEVRNALSEMGHVYPATTVSPALLRLVRRKHLRRLKQGKRWFYTG